MRFVITFLIFQLVLGNVHSDTTFIHGFVHNYEPNAGSLIAVLVTPDLVRGKRQIKQKLNQNGSFEISFDQRSTHDVFLKVDDMEILLLLEPGDNIQISWFSSQEDVSTVRFSGDGADRNRIFAKIMYRHYKEIDFDSDEFMTMGSKYRELGPGEFVQYRLNKKEEQARYLQKYISEQEIKDSIISRWLDYFLMYQPIGDLISYPILHSQLNNKRLQDLSIGPEYYGFLDQIEFNNEEALICSNYITFLHRDLYVFMRMQAQVSQEYQGKSEKDGMVRYVFEYISDEITGVSREAVLTRFLLEMMESRESISNQVPPLIEEYYKVVKHNEFFKATMKKYAQRFSAIDSLSSTNLSLLELVDKQDALSSIVHQFQNKLIYIDIWATWCRPCIKEMEYYAKMMERYEDEDIIFVFLAAHSPENLWKKRIDEYDVRGYHYLLSDEDYNDLEKYFELSGFPQHILIDENGKIIETNGPSIYSIDQGLNEDLINRIDNLLKK